jgi:hypothetical protein
MEPQQARKAADSLVFGVAWDKKDNCVNGGGWRASGQSRHTSDDHAWLVAHLRPRVIDLYLAAVCYFVDQAQERRFEISKPGRVLWRTAKSVATGAAGSQAREAPGEGGGEMRAGPYSIGCRRCRSPCRSASPRRSGAGTANTL